MGLLKLLRCEGNPTHHAIFFVWLSGIDADALGCPHCRVLFSLWVSVFFRSTCGLHHISYNVLSNPITTASSIQVQSLSDRTKHASDNHKCSFIFVLLSCFLTMVMLPAGPSKNHRKPFTGHTSSSIESLGQKNL